MLQLIKKALMPKQKKESVEAIITKIHNEFDSASDRLLKEAKEILGNGVDSKGERLKQLGFVSSKAAAEFDAIQKEKKEKQELAEKIEYYQMWYPNNKFIIEKEVRAICEKYGLVFSSVDGYKGDVPEKNLREIEAFKLREEDLTKRTNMQDYDDNYSMRRIFGGIGSFQSSESRFFSYNPPTEIKTYFIKPSFCICAPEKDFDMTHMVRRGYKLEYDPIVLQPVAAGYLVVSKWGIESEDESLVNEKMN